MVGATPAPSSAAIASATSGRSASAKRMMIAAAPSIASSVASALSAAGRAGRPSVTRRPSHKASRSEEHTSELQSLMRISYAVFCLKKKNDIQSWEDNNYTQQNTLLNTDTKQIQHN